MGKVDTVLKSCRGKGENVGCSFYLPKSEDDVTLKVEDFGFESEYNLGC